MKVSAATLCLSLFLGACGTQAGFTSGGTSFLAAKANLSDHSPHGHASSYYICEEQDLNIIYNVKPPVIKFLAQDLPITRIDNDAAEQYASIMDGEDVLLTILDHAATLQVGDKTYKTCEKISCVPLDVPN